MKKIYEWNTPITCNFQQAVLPNNEDLECRPCRAGNYYKGSQCMPCPAGMFITNGSYGEVCQRCGSGKYAPKIEEYSDWSQIPSDFEEYCISKQNTECAYGWDTRGTYLITAPIYDYYSFIALQKKVDIVELVGKISYSISIKGDATRLILYINGFTMKTYISNADLNDFVELSEGNHIIKFVCYHGNGENESCSIFEILIQGSLSGGASSCIDCPIGYYSNGMTDKCILCNPGFTSNSDLTGCVPCIGDFYSEMPGACKPCIAPTFANENHTACVTNSLIALEDSTFLIGNLSGTP